MSNTAEMLYCGRPITALSREELLEALTQVAGSIRDMHEQRQHEADFLYSLRTTGSERSRTIKGVRA